MSVRDIMVQIAALQRIIQDQQMTINDFKRDNGDRIQLVRAELQGSTKGYDQRMLNELAQTESSLNTSLAALQRAADALQRVQTNN